IALEDADIEEVVRRVVLRKKPDAEGDLRDVIDDAQGEIDRHLQGTQIAPSGSDATALLPDYPILPARRRFWELVLRAVDQGGGALLRSQLRSTHEAAAKVGGENIGNVIGADFIYDDQEAGMQSSGALLREVAHDINKLDDGTRDGTMKARLC